MPVTAPDQEVLGVVRLTNGLVDMSLRFQRLRTLILSVLAVELLVGVGIGLALALNLERLLKGVTEAIYGVANGRNWETLPEKGPQEIRLLLRSFNSLIERLRLMEETRRRLLANIVHEVGRPIGALQSALQALINGADRDEPLRRELLEGMEAEVERLHPLLDDLAKLHDQILGTLELDCRPTELDKWLNQTLIPGLSQEEQKQIFEPFYRSQRAHRFPKGMGLGLTIALDLVVAHGGRLEVESEPGQGSRFTVWLPREQEAGT